MKARRGTWRGVCCAALLAVAVSWLLSGCHAVPQTRVIGEIVGNGRVEVSMMGAVTTLTAVPASHWRFDRWTGPGDSSTENPHTIGTDRLAYYTAVFVPDR
ncbi:MAG: hypothetical protein V2A79_13805 [Planctomycetota bacterium]